jgi:hypothetical protein
MADENGKVSDVEQRWADGFDQMEEQRKAREAEAERQKARDKLEIDQNQEEHREMDRLLRLYDAGTYTDRDLARLKELKQKHDI